MAVSVAAVAVERESPLRLAVRVVRGRWFMAYACFLIMSMAGATYIFAVYSKDIKATLGYDQETLNTIGFFKDLGANVGIHAGLIAEVTPTWVIIAIAGATNLLGYLMIYLSITGRTPKPHVWQMCLYIAVGANSQAFANTGALVTCVKNFPESRGIVLGLLKGFVGLSGAVFTQLYRAFYGDDSKSLVLLVGWLPAAVSFIFLPTIRLMPRTGPRRPAAEFAAFRRILWLTVALAAFLLLAIVLQKQLHFTRPEYIACAVIILLLLLSPLAVSVQEELAVFREETQLPRIADPVATVELPPQPEAAVAAEPKPMISRIAEALRPPKHGDDYTILQALFSVDMALLFVATVFGVGGALTAIDNMGQIGESLGYPQRSIATFVSLISIWNYAGRVTAGFLSEIVLEKHRVPRPLIYAAVILVSASGHLLMAFNVPGCLYIASIIVGFCFGATLPLLLAIVSEVFGLKYYSTLYNFGMIASPVGSYVLNVKVAGRLYDIEARRQRDAVGSKVTGTAGLTCIGVECYRKAFVIIAAVTVGAAAVAGVLAWRTREFYRGDIYARFRGEAPVEVGGGVKKEEERETSK